MNQVVPIEPPRRSLIVDMASNYGMEPDAFQKTLKATVVPGNVSNEDFAAFLLVAKHYKLNPILKEIFAFPKRGGGIQPIVSVDGWSNLINSHPQADGFEFIDTLDDKGELVSVTCKMYRKDRSHPVSATEYMKECSRSTDTWGTWPRRMLRHKAMIQAARYAFGFAGIMDPDEGERVAWEGERSHGAIQPPSPPPAPQPSPPAVEHRPEPPKAQEASRQEPVAAEISPQEERALDRASVAGDPQDQLAAWLEEKIMEANAAGTMAILNEIDDEVCATLDTANRDDQRTRWNGVYVNRKVAIEKRR